MTTEPTDQIQAQLLDVLERLVTTDRAYQEAVKAAQATGGALVKTARAMLGLSQRELAQQMGIDFTYVSKIETGKAPPSKPFIRTLTQLLAGGTGRQTHTPDATSPLAKAD